MSDIRESINTTLNGFVAKFQEHPKKNGQSYTTHFMQSMYFSLCSLACAMMFALHAIFPMLFESTGGNVVNYLNNLITVVRERSNAIALADVADVGDVGDVTDTTALTVNCGYASGDSDESDEDSSEGAGANNTYNASEDVQENVNTIAMTFLAGQMEEDGKPENDDKAYHEYNGDNGDNGDNDDKTPHNLEEFICLSTATQPLPTTSDEVVAKNADDVNDADNVANVEASLLEGDRLEQLGHPAPCGECGLQICEHTLHR